MQSPPDAPPPAAAPPPPPPPPPAPAPASQRDWVVPVVVLVIALAIVAAIVIVGLNMLGADAGESPSAAASASPTAPASASATEESDGPTSPTPAPSGEETSVFDLDVGHCFSVDGDVFDTVVVVDCGQPHEYEAFHVFDHGAGPDEPYPGDDPLFEFADAECQVPFEEFVDHEYQTSIWYITSITPSQETWADGDREIVCTLNQQDANEEPITVSGSAEGSAE